MFFLSPLNFSHNPLRLVWNQSRTSPHVGLGKMDLGPSGHCFGDKEHKLTLYFTNNYIYNDIFTTPHITCRPSDGTTRTVFTIIENLCQLRFGLRGIATTNPTIGRPDICVAPTPASPDPATRSSSALDPSDLDQSAPYPAALFSHPDTSRLRSSYPLPAALGPWSAAPSSIRPVTCSPFQPPSYQQPSIATRSPSDHAVYPMLSTPMRFVAASQTHLRTRRTPLCLWPVKRPKRQNNID